MTEICDQIEVQDKELLKERKYFESEAIKILLRIYLDRMNIFINKISARYDGLKAL